MKFQKGKTLKYEQPQVVYGKIREGKKEKRREKQ